MLLVAFERLSMGRTEVFFVSGENVSAAAEAQSVQLRSAATFSVPSYEQGPGLDAKMLPSLYRIGATSTFSSPVSIQEMLTGLCSPRPSSSI